MSKNKKQKSDGHQNGRQVVHIEFSNTKASSVAIAGTFNDWRPEATPMIAMGDGRWLKDLVLEPGMYEYLLVVDGQWLTDPCAQITRPNPFGGLNSVLSVGAGKAIHEQRN